MRQGDKHCKQVLFNITQENASVTGSQLTSCHQGGRTAVKRSQREQTTHRDAARFVMLLESLSEKHRSRRRSLKTAKGKKGGLIGTAGREAERGQVQAWPSGAALRAPRERREAPESIGKQRLIAGGPARSRGCFQRLGALSQLGKHPKSQPEREEFGGFLRHKHTHTPGGWGGARTTGGWRWTRSGGAEPRSPRAGTRGTAGGSQPMPLRVQPTSRRAAPPALTLALVTGQPPDEIGAVVAEGGLGEGHPAEAVTRRDGGRRGGRRRRRDAAPPAQHRARGRAAAKQRASPVRHARSWRHGSGRGNSRRSARFRPERRRRRQREGGGGAEDGGRRRRRAGPRGEELCCPLPAARQPCNGTCR